MFKSCNHRILFGFTHKYLKKTNKNQIVSTILFYESYQLYFIYFYEQLFSISHFICLVRLKNKLWFQLKQIVGKKINKHRVIEIEFNILYKVCT